MNYRRLLLIIDVEVDDARKAIAAIRRVAPDAHELTVVAHLQEPRLPWLATEGTQAAQTLDELRRCAAGAARTVELKLTSELDAGQLSALGRDLRIDLLVVGQPAIRILGVAGEVRKQLGLPLLYSGSRTFADRPITNIVCVAFGERAIRAVNEFLREQGIPDLHVKFASGPTLPQTEIDLVVLARFPGPLLVARAWPAPVLVLSPPAAPAVALRRPLDVPDLVDDDGVLRARLLFATGAGRRESIPDQQIAFVARGKVVSVVESHAGDVEIAADHAIDHCGVHRKSEATSSDPRIAVEQEVRVIRPGTRPWLLFDAALGQAELSLLAKHRGPSAPEMLAVRMRPIRSCRAIRRNLRRAGLAPVVVDASAILDESVALDVDENFDAVRLARVGARMRGAGFPVVAIVHGDAHTPRTIGFAALKPEQVTDGIRWMLDAPAAQRTFEARIEASTGAALIAGNRIEIELDNAKARHWLLDAIAQARQSVHLQVYMALDDDIGSQVEAALAAAGARGVAVRVNVDSLHGFEGSFGLRNPLLERLRTRPGVELRVIDPITGAPSLEDIKQRDHRKLVIVDGTVALVGGRNLSHEYYSGFDEVKLTAQSLWREVPWLDAGARVEGPVVAELERTFLQAWSGAGGAPFEIRTPPPAGTTAARVVVHHGLRDACTLDTYVALIDSAKSHVNAVNGFPLILEIQHAMLRAIRRGVRVRSLLGNLTPTHDGTPFKGPWSEARVAATQLVHSRVDSIIAAGGGVYIFAVTEQPNWQRGLGTVYPHVHAKMMTVDGRIASVGSANLDVTAGYWENELILVVEDPAITRVLEVRIDELIAASKRVDRNDPGWQQSAQRREWMRHWPGVLSI
ncbi:MAG TPA: phosphatidylserine/phosphatidylglycerophosphate/cardiolipin synthase family protein [Thermoanaerobaculia bacterium]|nr:phosphatidylserine/phosphatidylglycerophosphate/cardiolipin synthase family protein [Thermoanaerobaculia bacterium]